MAVPAAASASSISGYSPPANPGGVACPAVSLLPGNRGINDSLVAYFQPGPASGYICGLPDGGTLVGTQLIVALYAPGYGGNGSIPIVVEEFNWGTKTVVQRGANNTTSTTQVPIKTEISWSNTSIANTPGSPLQFALNVPTPPDPQDNLTVAILGVVLNCAVASPGAGISIPANYPQLLTHDFGWVVWVVFFFAVGVGVATALRLRARHMTGLGKWAGAGAAFGIGFGLWFFSDYPLSAITVGSLPEAFVATPVVLIGMFFWLYLFPTEAKLYQVRFPVADTRDHMPMYGTKRFRVYDGPEGPEYIGTGGASQLQRILGVHTLLDDRVLTNAPRRIRNSGFERVKEDIYAEYLSPGETDGGPKILEVVKPRTWWLPWRAKAREQIEEYHRDALKGRVPPPKKVGILVYISPSRAFLAASGGAGSMMVQQWITGTIHLTKIATAFERLWVALLTLKAGFESEVMAKAHKVAYTLHLAQEIPNSKLTMKAIEDLAAREDDFLYDQVEWHAMLEAQVKEDDNRRAARGIPAPIEQAVAETRETGAAGAPKRRELSGRDRSRPAGGG